MSGLQVEKNLFLILNRNQLSGLPKLKMRYQLGEHAHPLICSAKHTIQILTIIEVLGTNA